MMEEKKNLECIAAASVQRNNERGYLYVQKILHTKVHNSRGKIL